MTTNKDLADAISKAAQIANDRYRESVATDDFFFFMNIRNELDKLFITVSAKV